MQRWVHIQCMYWKSLRIFFPFLCHWKQFCPGCRICLFHSRFLTILQLFMLVPFLTMTTDNVALKRNCGVFGCFIWFHKQFGVGCIEREMPAHHRDPVLYLHYLKWTKHQASLCFWESTKQCKSMTTTTAADLDVTSLDFLLHTNLIPNKLGHCDKHN